MQNIFRDPLRARGITKAAVQHRLDQRVATRQRVTDDHEIGPGTVEMCRDITFHQPDALCLELGAHGRINLGVRAAHLVTEIARQQRHATHEGPPDTENMNAHQFVAGTGFMKRPVTPIEKIR